MSRFALDSRGTVSSRLRSLSRRKSTRARALKYGLLAGNIVVLAGIASAVILTRHDRTSVTTVSAIGSFSSQQTATNPLDQLSSADIAVNVARMTSLPEATAVTNQADSENAQLAVQQASSSLVAKPQVVSSAFKSNKDIQQYTVRSNDTIASIAAQFGITSDSIMWSNDLRDNDVSAGKVLFIPPVNGIVYVVSAGDTPESLAQKYRTTKEKIVAYNDAELTGLQPGVRIIIPDGQPPASASTVSARSSGNFSAGFAFGGSPVYGYNGYDFGYCTWYVANRISVPSNWGNANTWDNLAPRSGWNVSTRPTVGAIGQTDRGAEGHVAIVEAVSPDGSQIKYSDMNGIAGWGRKGMSDWTSISKFEHYISH